MKASISNILGFGRTLNLGVQISHGEIPMETVREIFDKVMARLSGWKGKFLSLAGRATLIQSVT